MNPRIAINGFGRIGRMVLRAIAENQRTDLQVVAINDLGGIEENAYLFRYDSVHGRFPGPVTVENNTMDVGLNNKITVLAEPNPEKLPWKELGIDIVLECSGRFTEREDAQKHLAAGAKKVIISAPATGADSTIVYGVNDHKLTPNHTIISCGSCTTNCLAPVADVLHQGIGIEHGYMTTVHAYTGDQRLVDTLHKDPRRSRAAAVSMIPTSTGAAKALGLVLPELQGKLDGSSIRVPTSNVSVIDLTFTASRKTSASEINELMKQAAASSKMKSILSIVEDPLVSIDFNHSPFSSNFDITQTHVLGETFCRVVSWYDNEWGFSNRMGDVALSVAKYL